MTTGIDPEPPAWRLRWAAEQLGVDPEASPAEVRAALLRRLPEVDFVPPQAWRQALRILSRRDTGRGATGADEGALAEEERLRDEVEEFADCFWSLAPPKRRERWAELSGRCAEFPPLRARLRQLQPALDVDPVPASKEEPLVAELAGQVQFLFTLRPADRAVAWRALLRRIEGQVEAWETAARRLKKRQRALAALEPDLVSELASWRWRKRYLAWSRRRLRRWPQATVGKKKTSKLSWLVVIWIALSGIAGLFRGLFNQPGLQTETQRPIPTRPPVLSPGGPTKWPDDKEWKKFLEDFQKHQNRPGEPLPTPRAKDKATDGATPAQRHSPPDRKGGPAAPPGSERRPSP